MQMSKYHFWGIQFLFLLDIGFPSTVKSPIVGDGSQDDEHEDDEQCN